MIKKVITKILLFIVGIGIILSPFAIFQMYAHGQKHVYSKTYYAALVDKVNYLETLKDQKKIILIGGSNVAFGFNSELIENEFPEYKVVNFGLYAALGTKIMIDLSKPYINEGDIVVVMPEINSQSMSLYFDSLSTLKAIEDKKEVINLLNSNEKNEINGMYFKFVSEKSKIKDVIEPGETVYRRNNFNSHFDIEYLDENGNSLRTCNKMKSKRYISPTIKFSSELINDDFIEYLNNYYNYVISKNACCYYSFCPVNELACESNDDEMLYFYWCLRESLKMSIIGEPSEYLMDAHYFYDTNFHLNDAGSIYRSILFINDFYRDILFSDKTSACPIPDMPDYPPIDESDEDDSDTCNYFELVETSTGYSISRYKNDDQSIAEIRLPQFFNHKYVNRIESFAFDSTENLITITIPSTYSAFENGSFDNSSIKNVYLEQTDPTMVQIDYSGGFINNVTTGFKIYVPKDSLTSYRTDYNWQTYSKYLEGYDYHE